MTPKYIIAHHSLTKDGKVVNTDAIRRYHMSYRIDGTSVTEEEFNQRKIAGIGRLFETPWDDIGYHYLVELVGDSYVIIPGRAPSTVGAHTKGMNDKSLGVCFIGNYDLEPPPVEMLTVGSVFVHTLCGDYDIPVENIKGHRDYAPKTCPGNMFDLDHFRDLVRGFGNA